jgi:hypothetical protein
MLRGRLGRGSGQAQCSVVLQLDSGQTLVANLFSVVFLLAALSHSVTGGAPLPAVTVLFAPGLLHPRPSPRPAAMEEEVRSGWSRRPAHALDGSASSDRDDDEVPDSEPELEAYSLGCWNQAPRGWGRVAGIDEEPSVAAAAASGGVPVPATKQRQGGAADYDTVFTNSKAGMDEVDKDYVKGVVYEMSKDSNFFKNEQRKNEENTKRNLALKQRLEALSRAELDAAGKWADKFVAQLERTRDLSRTFIHVDMDMFFAAVEQMCRPELAAKPFAIGGIGMISTANYVARRYGVRSAMPGFIGKALCAKPAPGSALPPAELVFVGHDFGKYKAVSEQVKQLLQAFDPYLQSGGIDEVYLDVTDYMRTHGKSADQTAHDIRARVRSARCHASAPRPFGRTGPFYGW